VAKRTIYLTEDLESAHPGQEGERGRQAPNLAEAVTAGRMRLWQAATVAILRRDAPDLAAKAEARLTGDYGNESQTLSKSWAKAAARKAADGDRRYGARNPRSFPGARGLSGRPGDDP
jgi:hypothetical protein